MCVFCASCLVIKINKLTTRASRIRLTVHRHRPSMIINIDQPLQLSFDKNSNVGDVAFSNRAVVLHLYW